MAQELLGPRGVEFKIIFASSSGECGLRGRRRAIFRRVYPHEVERACRALPSVRLWTEIAREHAPCTARIPRLDRREAAEADVVDATGLLVEVDDAPTATRPSARIRRGDESCALAMNQSSSPSHKNQSGEWQIKETARQKDAPHDPHA